MATLWCPRWCSSSCGMEKLDGSAVFVFGLSADIGAAYLGKGRELAGELLFAWLDWWRAAHVMVL